MSSKREAGFYWVVLNDPHHNCGLENPVVARWNPDYWEPGCGAFLYEGTWFDEKLETKVLSEKLVVPEQGTIEPLIPFEKLTEYERAVLLSPHDIPLTSTTEKAVRVIDRLTESNENLLAEVKGLLRKITDYERELSEANANFTGSQQQLKAEEARRIRAEAERDEAIRSERERMKLWLESDARMKELELKEKDLKTKVHRARQILTCPHRTNGERVRDAMECLREGDGQ